MAAGKCVGCGCEITGRNRRCEECKRILAKARSAMYNASNRELVAAKQAARYKANRELNLERMADYRERKRQELNATAAAYRERHRETLAEKMRRRRAEKPEETRRLNAQRHARHPEAAKNASYRRRAAVGSDRLSKGLSARLYEQQGGLCACCGASLAEGYELDHIIPLARGGRNIDSNIQLLTKRCNRQKNSKLPDEFMQTRRAPQWQQPNH